MGEHDYSYDWLRAFATMMIVLCHVCQGFGISSSLGYYLGGTYVSVFLMLSAYLLGEHHRKRIVDAPYGFLKSRMNRLIPTYYTYLTIAIIVIGIGGGLKYLSMQQVVGHYLFLNWFIPSTRIYQSPLPQLGHLWFMSCIVSAYLIVTMFSLVFNYINQIKRFWIFYAIGMICVGSALCLYSRNFVYPFIVSFFPLIFFKGNNLFAFIRKVPQLVLIVILVICNLLSIIGFLHGLYEFPFLVFGAILINSLLWIAAAPFSQKYIPWVVAFISTISFEIYLVHHPFCLGHYSLVNFMPTGWAVIAVFVISIILAYLLHSFVKVVRGCVAGGG